MSERRKVEVFSAGCPVCADAIRVVEAIRCPACEVEVLDMHTPTVATRAAELGVRSVPAVSVDGRLADCCAGGGPDEAALRTAGVGQAR